MSADGLLCHCEAGKEGHPLGTSGCTSVVKAHAYPSFDGRLSRRTLTDYYRSWSPSGIYRELAKVADSPAERKRWRERAKLADHKF